ncbi:hypothetical protein [Litorivicinus lipolyticus]|uniref:hypothetical protein n=1 Tax=Litorivicinus lipolyticus TaxID=418701 RepID=UPI003B5BB3D9
MKTLHLLMGPNAEQAVREQLQPGDQWVSFGRACNLDGAPGHQYGIELDAAALVALMGTFERIETW